ncbi:MAG: hypothetical protein ACR2F0_02470 [Chthoniobacterales bacterium]
MSGANAGYLYSLLGGGDRSSNIEPAGVGNGRINDGFNKNWDLGGGVAANRTALTTNSCAWPNPIRFDLDQAAAVPAGQSFSATLYSQSGATAAGTVELRTFLDPDFNPYNGNEIEIDQRLLANTGTSAVALDTVMVSVNPATVAPGRYAVCARLYDGSHTRYLYAPELLNLTPSLQPPAINTASLARDANGLHFTVIGFPGQQVTVQATTDFATWTPLQTHTFTGTTWDFVDPNAGQYSKRFYRAVLAP